MRSPRWRVRKLGGWWWTFRVSSAWVTICGGPFSSWQVAQDFACKEAFLWWADPVQR